jgi:hypothetical protein
LGFFLYIFTDFLTSSSDPGGWELHQKDMRK